MNLSALSNHLTQKFKSMDKNLKSNIKVSNKLIHANK